MITCSSGWMIVGFIGVVDDFDISLLYGWYTFDVDYEIIDISWHYLVMLQNYEVWHCLMLIGYRVQYQFSQFGIGWLHVGNLRLDGIVWLKLGVVI